jgi:hypothetical protein
MQPLPDAPSKQEMPLTLQRKPAEAATPAIGVRPYMAPCPAVLPNACLSSFMIMPTPWHR